MHVDEEGYTRVLGRTVAIDRAEYTLDLYTPLPSFGAVDTVRCGDVRLDPKSFADSPVQKSVYKDFRAPRSTSSLRSGRCDLALFGVLHAVSFPRTPHSTLSTRTPTLKPRRPKSTDPETAPHRPPRLVPLNSEPGTL